MSNILEEIKSRVKLSEIISKKVVLKRKGKEYSGLCPFHSESTPSFTVNDDKQFYHCFGCHAHGNAFDFIMQFERMEFGEALRYLAKLTNVKLPEKYSPGFFQKFDVFNQIMVQAVKWYQKNLSSATNAKNYLQKRGISKEIEEHFKIGFAPSNDSINRYLLNLGFKQEDIIAVGLAWKNDKGKILDSFFDRVMFPIFDLKNQPIAFGGRLIESNNNLPKYKNSSETDIFKKGDIVYNLNYIKSQGLNKIIVTEGYMDVIGLYKAGIDYAVAPLGTALTINQLKLIWQFTNEPILCFDGDNAGQKSMYRAIEDVILPNITPGFTVKFIVLPEGKDPDEMVQSGQTELLHSLIENPISLLDMIWRKFVPSNAKTLDHEGKALVESNLFKEVSKIKDRIVCSNFYSAIKQRFWEEVKSNRAKPGERSNLHSQDTVTHRIDLNPEAQLDRQIGFTIGILTLQPHLVDKYFDHIIMLQTDNFELDNLINQIISGDTSVDISFLEKAPYLVKLPPVADDYHGELLFEDAINHYLINKITNEIKVFQLNSGSIENLHEILRNLNEELLARKNRERLLREEIHSYLDFLKQKKYNIINDEWEYIYDKFT
ncbi:MAG: DNA primase [Sphingobacteriia bacterium]|nr:DNA primase [Sphingobacteriia bacterium]